LFSQFNNIHVHEITLPEIPSVIRSNVTNT